MLIAPIWFLATLSGDIRSIKESLAEYIKENREVVKDHETRIRALEKKVP